MILDQIVERTVQRIEKAKKIIPLKKMKSLASRNESPFAFEKALKNGSENTSSTNPPIRDRICFICEVKKASPSKGILAHDFPYVKIAIEYQQAGASALSVLTEPDFFMGSVAYLKEIKEHVKIPVLQKDFFIDEYQIYEASAIRADAILLICAILSIEKISGFIRIADKLGMSCLVETHNEEEIQMAIAAGARIIGVNNRDLKTFETDIANSIRLRDRVPREILFVSESGIRHADDVDALRSIGVDGVLVGETLMKSGNIAGTLAALKGKPDPDCGYESTKKEDMLECTQEADGPGWLNREDNPDSRIENEEYKTKVKICGIKSFKDVEYANEALPDYIGFVFAKSRRHVDFTRAYLLKSELDRQIKAVGVFVNEEIDFIRKCCDHGVIDIIQLHGDEDEKYIRRLKKTVFKPIIKAVRVETQPAPIVPEKMNRLMDYPLFDTFQKGSYGGTGKTFDWSGLQGMKKPFFLAGGLRIDNVEEAIRLTRPFCVDISSGVETNGIKDRQKMIEIIQRIRSVR